MQILLRLYQSLLHVLYPPLCLSCATSLTDKQNLLCEACFHFLDLIPTENRCGICFQEKGSMPCACSTTTHFCNYKAAVFDLSNTFRKLLTNFKNSPSTSLAKTLASFLVLQIDALGWPICDYLVAIPGSKITNIDTNNLVTRELGKLLNRPTVLLKHKNIGLRQEDLEFDMRKKRPLDRYILNHSFSKNACFLLIDDFFVTGATLESAAYCLLEYHPKRIYGIALATYC